MNQLYSSENILLAELKYSKNIHTDYIKHSHCMLCIGFIQKGKLEIELDIDNSVILVPNKLILFNPRQLHKTNLLDDKSCGYHTLYINEDWCLGVQKDIFQDLNSFRPLSINLIDDEEFHIKFKEFYERSKKEGIYENDLKSLLKDFFDRYLLNKEQEDRSNALVNMVKEYVSCNINKEISLDELSLYTNYSKNHIVKIFRQRYGITPKTFIINQKINKAKKMILENKEETLTKIASDVGFYDQSHFNKHFKRIFAVSPSYYRK